MKHPSFVTTSYLQWEPALSAEEVFQQSVGFTFVSVDRNGQLFWIESRPEEGGRSVLMMKSKEGQIQDVVPKPFSARSRVFEYGGSPYVVAHDCAYFVNFSDQRIYKIRLGNMGDRPVPLTPEKNQDGSLGKYVDLTVSPDGRWLVFGYEKEFSDREAVNEIGTIDLREELPQNIITLASGSDFYMSPKFSPDGARLAWLEWSHPFMRWDSTLLHEAQFSDGEVSAIQLIACSSTSSISCIDYSNDGELFFSADFFGQSEMSPKNFYNIYASHRGEVRTITRNLHDTQYFSVDADRIVALALKAGKSHLLKIDPNTGIGTEIAVEPVSFSAPVVFEDRIYLVGVFAKHPSQLLRIDFSGIITMVKESTKQQFNEDDVSEAQAIAFPTMGGGMAYGYFYPPINSRHQAPLNEKPPVRVLIHGGPTAMTQPGFSKQLLFWTSQGYAVFDLNYRGSMGFGRKYRDALLEKWGLAEIEDVKAGLDFLRSQNLISDQAVVSGGSAGGYTVQRLLTFYPELFATGASHFGIGNLVTLQKLTHKYESHYLERLIGGTLETNLQQYEERSPIHHLTKLKSPMIIFQGTDDKVVPPENSREMAEILKEKGIAYEYYEYPGEGHGFRKKENLVDALMKEAAFFRKVLGRTSRM